MRIVADPNIPYVEHAFAEFGDVRLISGRDLRRQDLAECDVLLVRSTVTVDASLLADTPVRFVATATAGFDHVDTDWLRANAIAFAHAPGSNAPSVGEYIAAALLDLERRHSWQLQSMSLGIVGCGHVGREVLSRAQALGLHCVLNDPPLAEASRDTIYRPLDEALDCDIVTLHVPLIRDGKYPTARMVDARFLARMKPGATLINAARGEVVDPAALGCAIDSGRIGAAALDVWDNEPAVDPELVRKCAIATPHIAGHSFDAKVAGTVMLYRAYCQHTDTPPTWNAAAHLPDPEVKTIAIDPNQSHPLHRAVSAVYDIIMDDHALREVERLPSGQVAGHFDGLRKNYRIRRSFAGTRVTFTEPDEELKSTLQALGFVTDAGEARPTGKLTAGP